MEDANPVVEAIAMEEGKIVGMGTVTSLRDSLGKEQGFWDLNGRLVLPGFQDVHVHAVEAGINSGLCYIPEDIDLYDIPRRLRNCKNGGKFGDQGWIVAVGVDTGLLMEQVWENDHDWPIDLLDLEFPDTPVLILDNLGHSAVVNTAAFEQSDMILYYDEGNPPGGIIGRDEWDGQIYLTGVVGENAQQSFRTAAFPPSDKNKQIAYNGLLRSMSTLASYGITSVSDAGGFWKQAQTESWARAEAEGKMKVRASNAFYIYPDIGLTEQMFILLGQFSNNKTKLVRFNQAKIYVDGILSLGSSALNEPYEDFMQLPADEALGFEYFDTQEFLQSTADQLTDGGYQLHFHVTGDRGASIALDTISNLANNRTGPHRLTHCYLVDEADRGRFKELNVVADFQLAPSSLDPSYRSFISDVIGPTRASELLPVKEVLDTGAVVTLSSDWDADELDPLVKLKIALTLPGGKAIPDLHTAIKMMTVNPAIALQQEDSTGSLQVGKVADFVILSRNIFDLAPAEIDEAEVLVTVMNGERTYDPDGLYGSKIGTRPTASSAPGMMRFVSVSLGVAASFTTLALLDILF